MALRKKRKRTGVLTAGDRFRLQQATTSGQGVLTGSDVDRLRRTIKRRKKKKKVRK